MSSLTGTRKGTADKRILAVSDCGTRLLNLLRRRLPIPDALRLEVESHIQHLPSVAVLAEKAGPLDVLGTDLWNASTGLVHQDDHQQPQLSKTQPSDCPRLGVTIRVFAYLLLDIAHVSITRHVSSEAGRVRIVKIAFKAARLCLEATALDYALRVLERCAEYVVLPGNTTGTEPLSPQEIAGNVQAIDDALQAEYCLLRIMCAWKSDRLDTAHHFYLRLCSTAFCKTQTLVQEAADLFWCIARAFSSSEEVDTPILWLERGLAALNAYDIDTLDDDTAELRLSLTSDLVKRLLSKGEDTGLQRASQLVDELESEFFWHNRVTVQALKFHILVSASPPDVAQTNQVLTRVMKMIVLTESNFKMVMQMASKVSKFSLETALTAASSFIRTRLITEVSGSDGEDHPSRSQLERATVAFVHLFTSQTSTISSAKATDLQQLLDSICQCTGHVLTPAAIHACQVLIWRSMQATEESRESMKWCKMLQHPLFDGASVQNKARISRRYISATLDADDLISAREVLNRIPEEPRNEPITHYLAFKIALRSQDPELARDSLSSISRTAAKDPVYLFACAVEAKQSASREVARLALQALIEQRPPGIVLPSLLRAVAHLLIAELDDTSRGVDEIASDIVKVLETAADEVFTTTNDGTKNNFSKEIEWWVKSTYNLIIRIFTQVETRTIIRVLHACNRLFDIHTENIANPPDEFKNHRMVCDFLSATAMIVMARSCDSGPEDMSQAYREARTHIKSYMTTRTELRDPTQDNLEPKRTLEMLKYDLEGILRLEQWECVDAALRSCLGLRNVERWATLADLLVILHGHMDRFPPDSATGRLLTQVLQRAINETWRRDRDVSKVARWLRCSFSVCLSDRRSDFSFRLLEQAAAMAANGHAGPDAGHGRRHEPYPEAELQWLASSGFNRAVDLVSHGEPGAAEPWMDAALELARWAQDGGALLQVLTGKRNIVRERLVRGDKKEEVESTRY